MMVGKAGRWGVVTHHFLCNAQWGPTLATLRTVALQASVRRIFPAKNTGASCHFSSKDRPEPGSSFMSPLQADSLQLESPGSLGGGQATLKFPPILVQF